AYCQGCRQPEGQQCLHSPTSWATQPCLKIHLSILPAGRRCFTPPAHMAPRSHPLVVAIRAGLSAAADPARAKGAQAYMKSTMPFRGVPGPVQKRLWRETFAAHPLETSAKWQRVVLELWRTASFREERYAAVGLA